MSQQYNIRWRDGEQDELKRLIKNYNEKIRYYTKKKDYDTSLLPERIKYKEALGKIESRADFRRLKGDLEDFAKRGSTDVIKSDRGAKLTQYDYNRTKRLEKRMNALRAYERKQLEDREVTTRGKGTGQKRSQMGNIKYAMYNATDKNIKNMSQAEWEYFKKQMDESLRKNYLEERQELLRENYIKALENMNFPQEVIDLVKQVKIKTFIDTYNLDEQGEIDFIYDPLEMQVKIESIIEVWQTALQNE